MIEIRSYEDKGQNMHFMFLQGREPCLRIKKKKESECMECFQTTKDASLSCLDWLETTMKAPNKGIFCCLI